MGGVRNEEWGSERRKGTQGSENEDGDGERGKREEGCIKKREGRRLPVEGREEDDQEGERDRRSGMGMRR